jgi:diguanylate cyclase (GGDEF)-like protein
MAHSRAAGHAVDLRRRNWMPIVAVAGSVAPTILLVGSVTGRHTDVAVLAGTSLAMGALVTARMNWMFSSMRRQADQLRSHSESLQVALRARDALAADLRHQAFHDALTGLANRALLQDRMEHALARLVREVDTVALILFDLDGFKTVNDSLGHQAGDTLLVTVAERMSAVVRPGDTVARLGGDEFAVFMESVRNHDEAVMVIERVLSALREPLVLIDRSITLSASAGVAFGTAEKTTAQLLSEADAAMYEAKSHGRNRHEIFEQSMRSRIVERLEFTNSFAGALERSEFFVEFQPLFVLDGGQLQGFEALLRWQHPTLGLIAPLRFIPLAEETGFIVPLGRWVLESACLAAQSWPAGADGPPTVAVNLSARQLQDPGLSCDVRAALARSGLAGERLVLEVTEGMLVLDPEQTVQVLNELKQMGVSIAIDDFGTGYSSLSHLRKFPVDILKIDKSFIDQLDGAHHEGPAFVEAIIRLARGLDVATVAEGIEDGAQREALTQMGCDVGQGFLLSRPLGERAAAGLALLAATGATVNELIGQAGELVETRQPAHVL